MNTELNLRLARALWPEREIDEPTGCWRMPGSTSWRGRRIPDLAGSYEGMGLALERMLGAGWTVEISTLMGPDGWVVVLRTVGGGICAGSAPRLMQAFERAVVKALAQWEGT